MPAKPVLTLEAHSVHRSSENGKLFMHCLQVGLSHFGQATVDVWLLQR
jgi:hypothetical protein